MSAAFTLVELVLAVLLGSMIMLSFAAIYANSYGWFRTTVQGNMRQAGAVATIQAVARDGEKTTYLFRPPSPCLNGCCGAVGANPPACPAQNCGGNYCVGDVLEGCTNFDPKSPNADLRIYEGQSTRIFNYCVDGNNILWYTWRDYPPGTPPNIAGASCFSPPSVSCGTSLTGGQIVQLGQQTTRSPFRSADCNAPNADAAQSYFCRPSYANNLFEMNFIISGSTISTRIGTAMSAMNPN